jgi:hypothetical protein
VKWVVVMQQEKNQTAKNLLSKLREIKSKEKDVEN